MHSIENMTFDWQLHQAEVPDGVENVCNRMIQDRILPKIEQQLEAWDQSHSGLKCIIPKLEIDITCENFSLETIERLFIKQFKAKLYEKTNQAQSEDSAAINNVGTLFRKHDPVAQLLLYLKQGFVNNPNEVLELISSPKLTDAAELKPVKKLLSEDLKAASKMLNLGQTLEAVSDVLFEEKRLHKNADFVVSFLQKIQSDWLRTPIAEIPVKVWKDILTSASTPEAAMSTLHQMLAGLVVFKKNKGKTIEFLSSALLMAYCQFELFHKVQDLPISSSVFEFKNTAKNTSDSSRKTPQNTEDSFEDHSTKKSNLDAKLTDSDSEEKKTTKADSSQSEHESFSEKIVQSKSDFKTKQKETSDVEKKEKSKSEYSDEKQFYNQKLKVKHVGLFILHPFLNEFFKEAKVLENKAFKNPEKAVQLLHYLATGNEFGKDISLTLEKVMLGLPVNQPVFISEALSNQEKELCNDLLKATLKHWTVLENSGIDTLRAMFLVRGGTLEFREKSILIEAEHLAQDVLLQKLPWGLGMIKFNWLESLIQIIWKS